jgi:FixJ family two-component response regulator
MNPAYAPVHRSSSSAAAAVSPLVFVVDDDVSVRDSLESLIAGAGWQPRVFGSAQEFLAHPRVRAPSCLILDVALPDLDGLDLQRRIAAVRIDMPIIFVTAHGDVPMAVRAMKAGAVEFFTKPCRSDVLLNAIRAAIERSRDSMRREARIGTIRDRYSALTCRERQVMALVVRGRLNRQVGDELGISEITVKAHRGRMMQKMNAASLAHLIDMARTLFPETNPGSLPLSDWPRDPPHTHLSGSLRAASFAERSPVRASPPATLNLRSA